MRVGIEVGGTFTDLLCVADGEVRFLKVPSTPERPDMAAYEAIAQAAVPLAAVDELVHGSTVVTNAVLQRNGARGAFVTTAGFRDLLFLQRHNRERVFDLAYQKARPLTRRRDCYEVCERVLADGSVAVPLDERAIAENLLPALEREGYEAVAVCLLNAYINPAHERRLAEIIAEHLPNLLVTVSTDVSREFREYERASTTVIAAHVRPVVDAYLGQLETHLETHQFRGQFSLMQSNGGRIPPAGMRRNPVAALFSGPAAGVIGAIRQAARSGFRNLVTFDMGGTSTDVCLVEDGTAEITNQTVIDGLPVRTPLFDIVTVGAGSGSVVWVDEGGMLRVGPMSTGAVPGPACYGRGGNCPTITDAHVVRGTLRPEAFLGGRMAIDRDAANRVIAELAAALGAGTQEMASNAIRLAEANIVRAIQVVSTQRGRDPRDFALVAFGGAGPMHAARVAEDLGIATVVIPPLAGLLSAYGLLSADYILYDTVTRHLRVQDRVIAEAQAVLAEMRARMSATLRDVGMDPDAATFRLALEMRFVGQAFEVAVDIDPDQLQDLSPADLVGRFVKAHQRVYMHGGGDRQAIEIIAFRLAGVIPSPNLPHLAVDGEGDGAGFRAYRLAEAEGETVCRLGPRSGLGVGAVVPGPAVLEDETSTTFIPAGWLARVDEAANLILWKEL